MAALPPVVLAHAPPSALAAVLGGALLSSPQRDECSRVFAGFQRPFAYPNAVSLSQRDAAFFVWM
jgi:hypothetical protein